MPRVVFFQHTRAGGETLVEPVEWHDRAPIVGETVRFDGAAETFRYKVLEVGWVIEGGSDDADRLLRCVVRLSRPVSRESR